MQKLSHALPGIARLLLGFVFVVFGANGFLHFLPQPPLPPSAMSFAGGLLSAGYFFPLLKGIEVTAGALLLSGLFVPLALTLLAPIIVNIAAFHLFLAPGNYPMVALLLVCELSLAWHHRAAFAPMLAARRQTADAARTRPALAA